MRKILTMLLATMLLIACVEAPAPYGVTPTASQMEWQQMEYNMFMHFTIASL